MTEANQPIQMIKCTNSVDRDGNPAGGSVFGNGIAIRWHDGVPGLGIEIQGLNGALLEQVIRGSINRLEFLQGSKLKCYEYRLALVHLKLADQLLKIRAEDREKRGVAGTYEP